MGFFGGNKKKESVTDALKGGSNVTDALKGKPKPAAGNAPSPSSAGNPSGKSDPPPPPPTEPKPQTMSPTAQQAPSSTKKEKEKKSKKDKPSESGPTAEASQGQYDPTKDLHVPSNLLQPSASGAAAPPAGVQGGSVPPPGPTTLTDAQKDAIIRQHAAQQAAKAPDPMSPANAQAPLTPEQQAQQQAALSNWGTVKTAVQLGSPATTTGAGIAATPSPSQQQLTPQQQQQLSQMTPQQQQAAHSHWGTLQKSVLLGSPATEGQVSAQQYQKQEERRHWDTKLRAYFALTAPHKQKDVTACLDHYEGKEGGFEAMWDHAQRNFGPAPETGAQAEAMELRKKWRLKLKAYYTLVDSEKNDADIEETLNHFLAKAGGPSGYEQMWRSVQQRYGVIIDPVAVAASTQLDRSKQRRDLHKKQLEATSPVLRSAPGLAMDDPSNALLSGLKPRVVIMIVIGGVTPKLYRHAGPARQYKFNLAVANEVKVAMGLDDSLSVQNVTEGVDCIVVELDLPNSTRCGGFASAAALGNDLLHRVVAGEFPVGNIRRAYLEQLEGNPQRVFIIDGSVLEYRCTPGFRYHLKLYDEAVGTAGGGHNNESGMMTASSDRVHNHTAMMGSGRGRRVEYSGSGPGDESFGTVGGGSLYDPDPTGNSSAYPGATVGNYSLSGGVGQQRWAAPVTSTPYSMPVPGQGMSSDLYTTPTQRASDIHSRRTQRYAE